MVQGQQLVCADIKIEIDRVICTPYMEKKSIIRRKSKKGGAGERVEYSRKWLGMLASIE